ncbi:hypothetical protein BKA83DRAFT_17153 [Pisolithus microcarpus]|nr:hypothetical protein BKA83DRAFT_17153 [Pisolithus microcarpus]
MLAPSFETSAVGCLPLSQPSPVRVVSKVFHELQAKQISNSNLHTSLTPSPTEPRNTSWHSAAQEAAETLASTSASFLVHETPLTSANKLPAIITPVTPTRKRTDKLLEQEPQNDVERAYQDALQLSLARENQAKAELVGMHSTVILQSLFCGRLSSQLAAQEEKQKEQKKKKGKLVGNGLPRLLTGDEFYSRVVEFEKSAADEELEHKRRQKQREGRAEATTTWKVAEIAQQEHNKVQRQEYKVELAAWVVERDAAKLEKQQPHWGQPKLGKLEPLLPKPVFERIEGEDVGGSKGEGNEGRSNGGSVSGTDD